MGIGRARPGQDIYDTPIGHAATQNLVLEAAEIVLANRLGEAADTLSPLHIPSSVVRVKNGTSTNLRLGEAVELSPTKLLTNIKRTDAWFTAAVPDETRQFGIVLGGIPDGKIGPVQVAGVCPALVNVGATTDLWAYVSSGADVLVGDRFWGDVRILTTPPGTGEQLLWVKIEQSPQEWFGKADEEIVQDAAGTVSVWTGATPSDSTFNIASCLNWTGVTVSSGGRVTVRRIDRKPRVFPEACP